MIVYKDANIEYDSEVSAISCMYLRIIYFVRRMRSAFTTNSRILMSYVLQSFDLRFCNESS